MEKIDLTGHQYGRWTVLKKVEESKAPIKWHCICECGTKKVVRGNDMRTGMSKSCGCFKIDWIIATKTTHGYSNVTSEYETWQNIKR